MENRDGHVEWTKTLSENDEVEIRRNVVRGEAYLLESEVQKAIPCLQNIAKILDSIDAKPKYVKEK